MDRNTLIEDFPQVSIRRAMPQKLLSKPTMASPLSDSFPTPKAVPNIANVAASKNNVSISPNSSGSGSGFSSDTHSDSSSMWSKRSSGSAESDFDEMYDISSSESEGDLPIKLSQSVKKKIAPKIKYPPLVIPSPTAWPTIEKLKSAVTPLSPASKVNLAPSILAQLQSRTVPNKSATPSLDGNSTDDEAGSSSCPSTPDNAEEADDASTWELPIRLDPTSISLLETINADDIQETVIEIPVEAVQEMQEIVESPPLTSRMRLEIQTVGPPNPPEADDELSALSVPSPGGFFASLNCELSRQTWTDGAGVPATSIASEFYGVPWRQPADVALPTSTATKFYGIPWERPEDTVEHTIVMEPTIPEETGPVTAKKIGFSTSDDIEEVDELDEGYSTALQETAAANITQTALWLNAQTDYMKAVCAELEESDYVESFTDVPDAIPTTPDQTSPPTIHPSPSKKSVRFVDSESPVVEATGAEKKKRISPIHDGTFWQGWRHTKRSQRARDVFQHRQARAEAEHVKRTSCSKQHVEQLQGKYEITTPERPAPPRPISNLVATAGEDEKKAIIERAERERQALEQMQTSSWHLSAHKEINGGRLLTSPIVESFKERRDVRILDLAGQVHCAWAWDVAMEHPHAKVFTTVSSDAEAHVVESNLEGPTNHSVVTSPKPWELPFEDNYFDVISARNLYCHLKTVWPKGYGADEWDLTLRECLRCLKPGGFLEFDLLDAELVHPETAAQALGVEFAFNLKTRGYDPTSGKNFLPRLKRAGFQSIKRAWIVLPVADVLPRWVDLGKPGGDASATLEKTIGPNGEVESYIPPVTGSTRDVRAITGMVGARMWEQWMLKLNSEMGRNESRCLEGVAKALEESGKGNAGWRCLVGWARKGD